MFRRLFVMAALALVVAAPASACDACVWGDDNRTWCINGDNAQSHWPRQADCEAIYFCADPLYGPCYWKCNGPICYIV